MIDWSKITGFEWDAGNATKSMDKHGVTCKEGEEIFLAAPLVMADPAHSAAEMRFRALGATDAGRVLHVAFTVRGDKLRLISIRPANRKEKEIYENR